MFYIELIRNKPEHAADHSLQFKATFDVPHDVMIVCDYELITLLFLQLNLFEHKEILLTLT